MIIQVELENTDYCDGCPCCDTGGEYPARCNMEYWHDDWERDIDMDSDYDFVRPPTCKDKHGL